MDAKLAQQILDKVMTDVLGVKNPFSLEQFLAKYAFDIDLPSDVSSMFSGATTWAMKQGANQKYISMQERTDRSNVDDWLPQRRELNSMQDVLSAWSDVNFSIGERYLESENVAESDAIYTSQFVYRSQDCSDSKYVVFCDSVHAGCEYVVGCQRSNATTFSARVIDSNTASSSFNVIWSKKTTKCMFVDDCYDLFECMFCSHIGSKRFCIANMQFEEQEYYRIKKMVVDWLINA